MEMAISHRRKNSPNLAVILSRIGNRMRTGLRRRRVPFYLPEELYDDDVFLVSYPKSGNTWMRFLIGRCLFGESVDFTTIQRLVPDVHSTRAACRETPRPRIIKSHMPPVPEYKRVIYLARDGRDVAVSSFFHALKYRIIKPDTRFTDFLKGFHDGSVLGFGSWCRHVCSWLDHRPDEWLLIRYEDLRTNTLELLLRVMEFAGITVTETAAAVAVERSSFEHMQKLEREQHSISPELARSDREIPFVRRGESGSWRDFFDDETLAEFVDLHGSALRRLGYPVDSQMSSLV